MKTREEELLEYIVGICFGKPQTMYGIDVEAELARMWMPRFQQTASIDEILAWGKKFKELTDQKIADYAKMHMELMKFCIPV